MTVEALAARCVALIREVQGTGPYHLVGFSFGGVLAFEVALQLEAAGERVGMLCLLDAFYPAGTRPARFPMLRMLAGHAARFLRVGPRHIMDHLAVRRASAGHRREDEGRLRLHANPQVREQAQRILEASWTLKKLLARRYVARTFAGDVLLVRATEMPHRSESLPEPTHGWGAVTSGRLKVLDVECSHLDVVEPPHVEVVAREFRRYFAGGG